MNRKKNTAPRENMLSGYFQDDAVQIYKNFAILLPYLANYQTWKRFTAECGEFTAT
jgi:hypothetical protein